MKGNVTAINDAPEALNSKELVIKIVEGLEDYLSWEIIFFNDKGQSHLIKKMTKKFGKLMQNVQSHMTAGMLKLLVGRPMVKSEKISSKESEVIGWE